LRFIVGGSEGNLLYTPYRTWPTLAFQLNEVRQLFKNYFYQIDQFGRIY